MRNVSIAIEGKGDNQELVIRCKLKEKGKLSDSKKNFVIASTEGNIKTEGDITVGLNVYRKNPEYVKPE